MTPPDHLKHKIIFFTDFDGTITGEDICDWLVATEGYGPDKFRQSTQSVIDGTMSYREASREQLESIRIGFSKCIKKAMAHVQLDEGFLAFYEWALSADVPIVVLSGGLVPLIEATLERFIGGDMRGIQVVANEVAVREGFESVDQDGGSWRVRFRDDTTYGHDKAQAIKLYAEDRERMEKNEMPILLFAGDGISDLGAAGHSDLLFAKQGEDLIEYCRRHQLPFSEFKNWHSILKTTRDLHYGRKTVADVMEENHPASRAKSGAAIYEVHQT